MSEFYPDEFNTEFVDKNGQIMQDSIEYNRVWTLLKTQCPHLTNEQISRGINFIKGNSKIKTKSKL